MAEFGAHLTSTAHREDGDAERPDIFVALAQENLMASLKPALTHVLRILAESNPSRYGFLYRSSDEVYSLLDFLLNHYYLNYYEGSFAENFYGLKRVPTEKSSQLHRSHRIKSILFLVLAPYIKDKCDKKYEAMKQRPVHGGGGDTQDFKKNLQSTFLKVYPYIHLLYEGVLLSCHLLYVFGKLRYHTPLLPAAGVQLSNLSEEDLLAQETLRPSLDLSNKTFVGKCLSVAQYSTGSIAVGLSSIVSVGVFFLQFLEWWYSSDQHSKYISNLPNPEPPKQENQEGTSVSSCPVCMRERTNDTALAVSGYVFCYPCIYRFVSKNGRCPVTGYPASVDHIVRLYVTQSS